MLENDGSALGIHVVPGIDENERYALGHIDANLI